MTKKKRSWVQIVSAIFSKEKELPKIEKKITKRKPKGDCQC